MPHDPRQLIASKKDDHEAVETLVPGPDRDRRQHDDAQVPDRVFQTEIDKIGPTFHQSVTKVDKLDQCHRAEKSAAMSVKIFFQVSLLAQVLRNKQAAEPK